MPTADTLTCSRGHSWPGPDPACPVCGAAALASTGDTTLPFPGGDELDRLLDADAPGIGEPAIAAADTATPTATPTPHLARDSVPGYEIEGELGRGGMGVVYKARQVGLNRIVALKMILAGAHAGPAERQRFRAEAEAVAALQHPNIVQVYEVGEAGGHPYVAFEYVGGGSLATRLSGNPWPARDAAALVATLADAMQYAHERGIVHRDLKPANVLLAERRRSKEEGGRARESRKDARTSGSPATGLPKITDFGLAKRLAEAETGADPAARARAAGLTRTGAVVGTPSYIAPEQAGGRVHETGPATDVYALGAILYELLAGRPPFRGETAMDTLLQVLSDDPVPVRRLSPTCPRDLETVALKCLQKRPERRYASAAELADDLRRFLDGEPVRARPVGPAEKAAKWMRRRPAIASLAVLSALLAVGVVVGSVLVSLTLQAARENEASQKRDAIGQRAVAEEQRRIAEANAKAAEAQRRIADQRVEELLHSQYALQLTRIAALAERDPSRAASLLADEQRCPPRFRDFSWGVLVRRCLRELALLEGHSRGVSAVAFSPAGVLASTSWDKTARLWDADSRRALAILEGHDGQVFALAFSPDGKWLATGSNDRTVRLWDLSAIAPGGGAEVPVVLKPKATLTGHADSVLSVAFSPDGKTLASGGYDRVVRRWDLSAGIDKPARELEPLKGHAGSVGAVVFAPDGRWLASGGADKSVRLWDVAGTGKPPVVLVGPTDAVAALAFSPDGTTLAAGGEARDRSVRLWDLRTESPAGPRVLKGHTHAVYALSFAPDGRTLASAGGDGSIRLWPAAGGQELTVLAGHRGPVSGVAFGPGGRTLASGGLDGTVRLWVADSRREETVTVETTRDEKSSPVAAADEALALLAISEPGGSVRVWDPSRGVELARLQGHAGPVTALTLAAGRAASAGEDRTIRLWDLSAVTAAEAGPRDLTAVRRFGKPAKAARALALSPDGRLLAVGEGSIVRLYETAPGREKEVRSWEAHPGHEVRVLAFAPDGRTLASGGSDQDVRLWYTATGASVHHLAGHESSLRALAFSPDGRTLASADEAGDGRLWAMAGDEPPTTLAHFGDGDAAVTGLHFSPDGRTLATGHRDRTVRLRDSLTGQERATLTGHTDGVLLLQFAAGVPVNRLLSLAEGGEVKFWRAWAGE